VTGIPARLYGSETFVKKNQTVCKIPVEGAEILRSVKLCTRLLKIEKKTYGRS
jgi:hypothetical protein